MTVVGPPITAPCTAPPLVISVTRAVEAEADDVHLGRLLRRCRDDTVLEHVDDAADLPAVTGDRHAVAQDPAPAVGVLDRDEGAVGREPRR